MNANIPAVSIIIPTFNQAEMVRQAVQSVLNQTYTDYEIIVVDDGSTDNTRETVEKLSNKITYSYQPHRGRSGARNHCVRLSQGKYIAFLDSDDLFLPAKLEKQVALMEANPDVMLSHTSYQRINENGEYSRDVKTCALSGWIYPAIIKRCIIATPTVMVRREALLKHTDLFNETVSIGEDVILWAQLAKKSRILCIDEPLTQVRIRRDTTAFDKEAQMIGIRNIVEYTIKQDPDLSFYNRQLLLANAYLKIGYCFLLSKIRKKERVSGINE